MAYYLIKANSMVTTQTATSKGMSFTQVHLDEDMMFLVEEYVSRDLDRKQVSFRRSNVLYFVKDTDVDIIQ